MGAAGVRLDLYPCAQSASVVTQIAEQLRLERLPQLQPAHHHRLARQTAIAFTLLAVYATVLYLLGTETGTRSGAPPIYSWFKRIHLGWSNLLWLLPLPIFFLWRNLTSTARWQRLPDWILLPFLPCAVFVTNVAMACTDGGVREICRPFNYHGIEFYTDVHFVTGVGQFLHDFVSLHNALALHSRTHPPGPILFLYAAQQLIAPGLAAAAFAAIAVTSLSVIPLYLLTRRLYGNRIAWIATGLYLVAPSLVLFGATSMDGVYTLPLLTALYFFFRGIEAKSKLTCTTWSLTTGLLLTLCTLMTFSTVCLALILGLYGIIALIRIRSWKRIWSVLLITGLACVAGNWLLYKFTGYDVIACVKVSMSSDVGKMGPRRRALLPYLDVSVANFLAFIVGSGVITSLLWGKQIKQTLQNLSRGHAIDPLLFAFAIAMPLLALSTLYRWETERIWTFLTPLVLIAAAKQIAHAPEPGGTRKLLDTTLCGLFAQTYLMQILLFTMW